MALLPSAAISQESCETLVAQYYVAKLRADAAQEAYRTYHGGEYWNKINVADQDYQNTLRGCRGGPQDQCVVDAYYEYSEKIREIRAELDEYMNNMDDAEVEATGFYYAMVEGGCS